MGQADPPRCRSVHPFSSSSAQFTPVVERSTANCQGPDPLNAWTGPARACPNRQQSVRCALELALWRFLERRTWAPMLGRSNCPMTWTTTRSRRRLGLSSFRCTYVGAALRKNTTLVTAEIALECTNRFYEKAPPRTSDFSSTSTSCSTFGMTSCCRGQFVEPGQAGFCVNVTLNLRADVTSTPDRIDSRIPAECTELCAGGWRGLDRPRRRRSVDSRS